MAPLACEVPGLQLYQHPRSCSHWRVYCHECGYIGNTERLDELPPCPKETKKPAKGDR